MSDLQDQVLQKGSPTAYFHSIGATTALQNCIQIVKETAMLPKFVIYWQTHHVISWQTHNGHLQYKAKTEHKNNWMQSSESHCPRTQIWFLVWQKCHVLAAKGRQSINNCWCSVQSTKCLRKQMLWYLTMFYFSVSEPKWKEFLTASANVKEFC